jgi:cytochrome c-type biogenesis protein
METVLTSMFLGLLAAGSPCILPLYPGFLAYLAGNQTTSARPSSPAWAGFFVLAGVLTMMLGLGSLIGLASLSMGRVLSYAIPISDLTLIVLGGLLLFNVNPFSKLPRVHVPVLSHPFVTAYLYGLLYGPITLPCSGPLVVGIFAYSLTLGEAVSKLSVFFWYGLGFGLPLLLISLISSAAQRRITRFFAQRARLINLLAAVLLLGVGGFGLANHWDLLVFFWSGASTR